MVTTVLLAFGPRGVTREAVTRARRWSDEVVVLPAVRQGARGLGALRSPVVTVIDDVGREGLLRALAGRGDDPVLLLHDDVLLAGDAARLLVERAVEHGCITVPATNEPGTVGYLGTAPPDVVPALAPGEPDRECTRFRTSVLAGPASTVLGHEERRLTAADTEITTVTGHALLVGEARATHLDGCRDQLAPPEGPDGRPLLVAALIVRDEEDFLADCLASLDGIVDRIELVDTGSVDATMDIAREYGANVHEREWRNDFAWARNEALEYCRDAWWVLGIDADERLLVEDPAHFRSWLATAVDDPGAFTIRFRDVLPSGGLGGLDQQWRIFPSTSHYRGRLHELPYRPDGTGHHWTVTDLAEIHHLGYLPDVLEARKKGDRNTSIAKAQWDEKGDVQSAYNYARSLRIHAKAHQLEDESLELYQWVAGHIEEGTDGLSPRAQSEVLVTLTRDLLHRDELDAAWEMIQRSVALDDDDPDGRIAFARIANRRGEHALVVEHLTRERLERPGTRERLPSRTDTALELALAHLALEDVDSARTAILDGLAETPSTQFNRWVELVSVVAIVAPADADTLLRPGAVHSPDTTPLEAVVKTFHAQDAAEFATSVVAGSDPSSPGLLRKAMFALVTTVVADRPDLVGTLLALDLGVPEAHLRGMRRHASLRGRDDVAAQFESVLQASA